MYMEIEKVIDSTRKETSVLVIAGDFNSEIGRKTEDDQCMGKYSSGKRNENGQCLINFCEANNLLIYGPFKIHID